MPFISITRLRVRSIRFLPFFMLYTFRSLRQVKSAAGFQNGGLLADRSWTFWTMTAWDNQESMRRFMTAGSHKEAMPRLLDWCDEASVVHWDQTQRFCRLGRKQINGCVRMDVCPKYGTPVLNMPL
jgi:hypothetical protein